MKENYKSITQFVLDNLKDDKINIKAFFLKLKNGLIH